MGLGGSIGGFVSKVGGGLSGLLMGEKTPGTPGSYTQLEQEQKNALAQYNNQLAENASYNPGQLANIDAANRDRQIFQGAKDQEQRAQQLVVQRGLGNSSVGLNAILGANRNVNNDLFASRAQRPLEQMKYENNKLDRLNSLSGGINNIFNTRMYNAPVAASRGPGLLGPLLGAAGTAAAAYYTGGASLAAQAAAKQAAASQAPPSSGGGTSDQYFGR